MTDKQEDNMEIFVEKLGKIADMSLPKIDTPEQRARTQLALCDKEVDLNELKSKICEIKQEKGIHSPEEWKKLENELKTTQMTNEALKGILGQFVTFLDAFIPEIKNIAGEHQSFLQIQQMLIIGKMLANEPTPENIKKELHQ